VVFGNDALLYKKDALDPKAGELKLVVDQVVWLGLICSVERLPLRLHTSNSTLKARLAYKTASYIRSLKPQKKYVFFRDQMTYSEYRSLCSFSAVQKVNTRFSSD
jgi:hypothetical protein